jgi:hypothetical protein
MLIFAASPLYLCDLLKLNPFAKLSSKKGFKTKNNSKKVIKEIHIITIFLSFSQSSKRYIKINEMNVLKYLENSTIAS